MITDKSYFENQTNEINQIIYNNSSKVSFLEKMTIRTYGKEKITKYYNDCFFNFPFTIEDASEEIGISIFATELFELYYDLDENMNQVSSLRINEVMENRKKFIPENHLYLIIDYLDEFIYGMVYFYDKLLENTKKHHFFKNIDDEKIILLNLLKRYKSVVNDEAKQIDVFWSIKLTKTLSDLIIKIFIEFIEQRLNILTINFEQTNFEYKTTYVENKIHQIKWNGTQQDFCELIIELEKKNWIEKIQEGNRKKLVNSITKIFNLENTKKNENSDQNNSLYQLLKGEYENKERIYPFLENVKYKRKFDLIKKNNG